MALTNIEYGSVASSKLLNDNFNYLEDLIAGVTIKLDSFNDGVDSKISTTKKTLQIEIDDVRSHLLPTGSIIAWSSTSIPDGWIAMIGQDITAYTKLSNKIGKTKLPDTRNRVLWGNATPFNTIEAGLPNIEAEWSSVVGDNKGVVSGAVTTTQIGNGAGNTGWTKGYKFNFDASLVNEVYGNSNTVQPPAVTVVWIIKYE